MKEQASLADTPQEGFSTQENSAIEAFSEPTEDIKTDNYYDAPFGLNISFPEAVTIRMVDASALNDYEVLILFTGLFCNVFCGFVVGAIATPEYRVLFAMLAVLFLIFTVGFFAWALVKRMKMAQKAKAFKLKTSGVVEVRS